MISVQREDEKISENYGSFKIQFNYIRWQRRYALGLGCPERDQRQPAV